MPPPTPEMIARQQARSSKSMSGLVTSKATALASRSLAWGARRLRQSNEQAAERDRMLADLESLERREAQLRDELQSWKAKEMQLQSELHDWNQSLKLLNKDTDRLNKGTKKLKDKISWHQAACTSLKNVLESLESELLRG